MTRPTQGMTATELAAYDYHADLYPASSGPLEAGELAVAVDVGIDEAEDVISEMVRAGWFVELGGGWLARYEANKQPGERPQSEGR